MTAYPLDGPRRQSTRAASSGAVAGAALWISLGQLALESAGPQSPRLGLLPPLAVLLAAVAGCAAAVYALHRFSRLRRVSGWYYPLYCTAIVGLPWLPVPIPTSTLVWAGPAAWWIWGGAGMAIAVIVSRSPVFTPPAWLEGWLQAPRATWTAAALAALLYGGSAAWLAPLYPGGDEPHYLVITQSLLLDRDLKIENNHERQDHLEYFDGALSPHYLRRGIDGAIYSVHAPGLPALLLPAFGIGGYPGVVVFLIAVASVLSAMVWRAAFLAAGRCGPAWFGWAAVMLSVPVLFHAFAVYPEIAGATIVMAGAVTLVALDRASRASAAQMPERGPERAGPLAWPWWRWLLLGAGLALLPWLHTRYVVLAAVLGVALAGRLAGRTRWMSKMLALFAAPAASAAAWLCFFKVFYGTFSPSAPYGHYTQTRLAYAPVGLQGLLFDQQFGLMATAPVLLAALVGFVVFARSRRRLAVELFTLVTLYSVAAATYRMWWGGWSAPARFLVAVVPVLAVPAALWWNSRRASGKLAGGTLLGLGVLVSATELLARRGTLIINPRDAVSRLYEWLSPLVEVNLALPSSFRAEALPALLLVAIWVCVLLGVITVVSWGARRMRGDSLALRCAATVAAAALGVMAALELCWRIQGVQPMAGATSRLNVLDAAAAPSRLGVSYAPFGFDSPARLVSRLRLSQPMRRALPDSGPAYQLAPVPSGVYRLVDETLASSTTTLDVRIGRGESPIARWRIGPETRTVERTLRLPCRVNAVIIDADAATRTALSRVALQPVQVWSGDGCPDAPALRALRYGSATVFFFDESAYPEERGFWVRGQAEAFVAVMPDGSATAATLQIRGGAAALRVHLASGSWHDDLALQAGELKVVQVPVDRRTGAALLRIRPDGGFVPSAIDPASADRRFLACWITNPE